MINIPAMLQNYDSSDVDLIMTISTPCLAGACSKVKHKPVVFTCVTDPIAAGAGKSHTDHLPFVTGVGSFPPVSRSLDMMQKLVPGLRAVGTMYNPAEANSVKEMAVAREVFRERGIRLEEIALAGSNEVLQAVQILAGRDIQVVWLPGDNTAIQGYEGAVKGAKDARLPLITDECSDAAPWRPGVPRREPATPRPWLPENWRAGFCWARIRKTCLWKKWRSRKWRSAAATRRSWVSPFLRSSRRSVRP